MTDRAPPNAGQPRSSTRWQSARLWIVLGAVVIVVALIVGAPPKGGSPLDPRSTSPAGTKALVLLLRRFNATVELTTAIPGAVTDVAVVLSDRLDADRRAALQRWVSSGGTAIVADPVSDLQPAAALKDPYPSHALAGPCPDAGLADVGRIDTGGSLLLRAPPGAVVCFAAQPGDSDYFLVDQTVGRGRMIGLGGAGVFTNRLLAHDDNSVLAVELLAAGRSNAHVDLLIASPVGGGHRSLASLLGAPVKLALVELAVAFVILVLWRARRLGRPVYESQPVQMAASELVVAVGSLLQRSQSRDAAAAVLRGGLRRWLTGRFGLPPAATIDTVADAGSIRAGVDRDRLTRALGGRPLADDAELIELAQSLERIRQEVAHGRY